MEEKYFRDHVHGYVLLQAKFVTEAPKTSSQFLTLIHQCLSEEHLKKMLIPDDPAFRLEDFVFERLTELIVAARYLETSKIRGKTADREMRGMFARTITNGIRNFDKMRSKCP